jgi:hypothetical protein
MTKRKRTNSDLQNIHIKLKIKQHEVAWISFYFMLCNFLFNQKQVLNDNHFLIFFIPMVTIIENWKFKYMYLTDIILYYKEVKSIVNLNGYFIPIPH